MAEVKLDPAQQDETPFRFRGGDLALDLINTESNTRGKRRDLLVTPQDIALWWQEAVQQHPQWLQVREESEERATGYDTAELSTLKTLRAALREIFSALVNDAAPHKEDIAVLNTVLRTGYWSLDLTARGEMQPIYRTTEEARGPVLLACALSALYLIREGDRKRLHQCESDRCILFFYDTTRSATRRWCSTACMDRARAMQRYHQAKQNHLL